jgi:FkbM family methyltransferase
MTRSNRLAQTEQRDNVASKLRLLAERLSRSVVFSARLPALFGRRKIFVSPANQLAIWKPGDARFQKYLLGFADRFVRPGDVVWDFGANMGMFAVPAATRAKFTLAVEPDPFNQLLLQRTRLANPDLAFDVMPVALSDAIGVSQFAIPERGRSANSLVETSFGSQMGGTRQLYSVMTVTADWLLSHFAAPNFVKIDIEGAELMVLRGATKLLNEVRPVIIVEMPNEHADDCAAIFQAAGYLMFRSYDPVDPAKAVTDIHDIWDVLAIPHEKLADYAGR